MPARALELCGLKKHYPGTMAVDFERDELLEFDYGVVHALAGQNGAGKSTLVSLIAGITRPSAGDMRLGGAPYAPSHVGEARKLGVDIVVQEPLVVESMTVEENLLLGRERSYASYGVFTPRQRRRLAELAMSFLPRRIDLKARTGDLTLEDQKLIELARAVSIGPRVLIVDEMSAALSYRDASSLRESLRAFAAMGRLVIYVSHHLDEVVAFCDRVTVMRNGRPVATLDARETNEQQISSYMVGHVVDETRARTRTEGKPVLDLRSISVQGRCEEVSVTLHAGEVVGIGGLKDSGAEAVGMCAFGALRPTKGTLRLDDHGVTWRRPAHAVAAGVAYVPSNRDRDGLLLGQRIDRNIVLAALRWITRRGIVIQRAQEGRVQQLIERLQIACRGPGDLVANLSGGNRQKVVIAKWMIRPMRVLILQDPTRGVDIQGRAEIHSIINELSQQGLAIMLISDDLRELVRMSDTLMVMRKGRVVCCLGSEALPSEHELIGHMM